MAAPARVRVSVGSKVVWFDASFTFRDDLPCTGEWSGMRKEKVYRVAVPVLRQSSQTCAIDGGVRRLCRVCVPGWAHQRNRDRFEHLVAIVVLCGCQGARETGAF